MPIVPDTKDWTWVLDRPCPECGCDSFSLRRDQVSTLIRSNAEQWRVVLSRPSEQLRRRPRDDRWSPLEYACHVRDVFELYHLRLRLMLTVDNPTYPNWDQHETAVAASYNTQDPLVVAGQLLTAAGEIAATFDTVTGVSWDRREATQRWRRLQRRNI